MGWLIDTGLWIAVERGALGAADIQAITRQDPVYLSPVNIAEIRFGLELLRPGPSKQRATAALRRLRRKPQLRITVETAETFGTLAAKLSGLSRAQLTRQRAALPMSNGRTLAFISWRNGSFQIRARSRAE